jgi:transketolase
MSDEYSLFDTRKEAVLKFISERSRKRILDMIYKAQSGHPGGSLSVIDMLTVIRLTHYREGRDRLVLSKGHAAPALYALLTELGYIGTDEIEKFRQVDSELEGHLCKNISGVDVSSGVLGQGLSYGVGLAIAAMMDSSDMRIFVILGDGECQEGQVSEAAKQAAFLKLHNLTAFIDMNHLQIDGRPDETSISNISGIFQTYGWSVKHVDGHNLAETEMQIKNALRNNWRPTVLIANTIKGKGVTLMEDNANFHGKAPDTEQYNEAVKEVEGRMAELLKAFPGTDEEARELLSSRQGDVDSCKIIPELSGELVLRTYTPGDQWATRESFGHFMEDNADNERLIGMTADLKKSVCLQQFRDNAGKFDSRIDEDSKMSRAGRFIQFGISEANMSGTAIGLALAGKHPYAATFAAFMPQQMANIHMANYMNLPVTYITTHTGLGVGEDGPTHQVLDASLLKNFHNVRTFEPCNAIECNALLAARFNRSNTVDYFRLTRQKLPVFELPYEISSETIDIGCGLFANGKEPGAYIIASGATVAEALSAQKLLMEEKGPLVDVINLFGLDAPGLGKWLRATIPSKTNVFTFQDAYPECLRDVVSSGLCGHDDYNYNGIIRSFGPTHGKSGKQKELYKKFKIDSSSIADIIKQD